MKAQFLHDRRTWNDFIASSTSCSITQTYEWGEFVPNQRHDVLPIGVIDDDGKLCAAMLVFVMHVKLIGGSYFYAPGGPIIDDPDSLALDVLLDFVQKEAKKRNAFMLKVEPGACDHDAQWLVALARHAFRPNTHAHQRHHEWIIDLRLDEEALLADMRKKWRYNIRLATRKQVVIRAGEGLDDIATFYRLLNITSIRDSFAIDGRDFYERFICLYGSRAKLFIAEYEGEPLGAVVVVVHGRWCWYMYGASGNVYRAFMPNHLLQWTALRWAKAQGCWYYNFHTIPDIIEPDQPMWGVYVFKSGFGGYALRFLETHDLVYKPVVYQIYCNLLSVRQRYFAQRQRKPHMVKSSRDAQKLLAHHNLRKIDEFWRRSDDTFEGSTYRMLKNMR